MSRPSAPTGAPARPARRRRSRGRRKSPKELEKPPTVRRLKQSVGLICRPSVVSVPILVRPACPPRRSRRRAQKIALLARTLGRGLACPMGPPLGRPSARPPAARRPRRRPSRRSGSSGPSGRRAHVRNTGALRPPDPRGALEGSRASARVNALGRSRAPARATRAAFRPLSQLSVCASEWPTGRPAAA